MKDDQRVLMIWSLGSDGAKQLASGWVPEAERAARVADLKARGLALAETDWFCDFVWICNADGSVEVFDDTRKVLEATGDRMTLEGGRIIARTDIARVIAFADGYTYRGVKAVLPSGEEVGLATEYSMSAEINWQYNRNDLLWETGWCSSIGYAIARWAGLGGIEDLI